MSLEQMRDAPEVEVSSYEQSILNKRTGRKRKAPLDDEVSHKNNERGKERFCSQRMKQFANSNEILILINIDVNIVTMFS